MSLLFWSDEKIICNNTKQWKEFGPTALPLFTLTVYNYFYVSMWGVHLRSPTKFLAILQFHKQMFRCRFPNHEIDFEVTLHYTVLFQIMSGDNNPWSWQFKRWHLWWEIILSCHKLWHGNKTQTNYTESYGKREI